MIRVLGVPQLLARFARAAALGEVAENAAVSAVAVEVAETARSLVPVDTGTLRDSIQEHAEGVSVTAPYAGFVEYGTAYVPAQPYLRPAADEAKGEQAEVAAKTVMDRA